MGAKGQIIITGVSSGIGLAIAKLALETGFSVQGIGRNEPKELTSNPYWFFTTADLSQENEVEDILFKFAADPLPTVLINNAGTLGAMGQAKTIDWNDTNECMTLNVTAPMRLTARFMSLSQESKQVFFTGSGAAEYPINGWSSYCASKAAIHMYAEVLAQENPSVPIHAFTPGKVDTPMQAQIRAASKEDFPGVEHFREEYADGLLVKPEAVAKAVLHVVQNPGEQPVVFPTSQITTV